MSLSLGMFPYSILFIIKGYDDIPVTVVMGLPNNLCQRNHYIRYILTVIVNSYSVLVTFIRIFH